MARPLENCGVPSLSNMRTPTLETFASASN